MHSLVVKLADYCVDKKIIESEHTEWFVYGLKKRFYTVFVAIPFLILATVLSSVPCAISFFFAFFILRGYIGGFHASTIWWCLIISLLSESVILCLVYPFLSGIVIACITILCVFCIFALAPYNHPNMHWTNEELVACRKISRLRSVLLSAGIVISSILGFSEIAKGFTLGIALATAMLCLGYIFDRRISK